MLTLSPAPGSYLITARLYSSMSGEERIRLEAEYATRHVMSSGHSRARMIAKRCKRTLSVWLRDW